MTSINRKKLLALVGLGVVLAGLATGYFIFSNNHDVTTSVDTASYTKTTSIEGITFWMSKQWATPNISTYDHIDTFNFISKAERSMAGQYEIQLYLEDNYSKKQLNRDEILTAYGPTASSIVEDLQLYHVNGKLVADYIQKGTGSAINQRIISMRNSSGTKQLRMTINRNDDSKLTKDNFDGLMPLVGSITFN